MKFNIFEEILRGISVFTKDVSISTIMHNPGVTVNDNSL